MAKTSNSSFSYQKLKPDVSSDDEESKIWDEVVGRSLRRSRFRRVHVRRKLRVKITRIERLLLSKRASVVKVAWMKVCKRLRESGAHFGDLFAGNYMFMQVTPPPLNSADHRYIHGAY